MHLFPYNENKITTSSAAYVLGFSSYMMTLTITSIQGWFSPLKCLVESNMINEDGFKIGHFDPYIIFPLVSTTRASCQTLIVHHLNMYGRAQPASSAPPPPPPITKILCFNPTTECHISLLSSLRSKLVCIDTNL